MKTKPKKGKKPKAKKAAAETKPIEIPPAAPVEETTSAEEAKPKTKKAKTIVKDSFHFDPPQIKYECKPVDAGWRGYRLWSNYELDWKEEDDDAAKMKSIRKCIAKSKAALVEATKSIDGLSLQTDLKKDQYPFEPFVEVWISRDKESETIAKLIELSIVSVVDADHEMIDERS